MNHNLLFNNCHSHAAVVLNELRFLNFSHWNTLTLILFLAVRGRFTSGLALAAVVLPFAILVTAIILLSR
jgi:hypothetical protein